MWFWSQRSIQVKRVQLMHTYMNHEKRFTKIATGSVKMGHCTCMAGWVWLFFFFQWSWTNECDYFFSSNDHGPVSVIIFFLLMIMDQWAWTQAAGTLWVYEWILMLIWVHSGLHQHLQRYGRKRWVGQVTMAMYVVSCFIQCVNHVYKCNTVCW